MSIDSKEETLDTAERFFEDMRRIQRETDEEFKRDGFKHYVRCWVESGEVVYPAEFYFKNKPTPEMVSDAIRNENMGELVDLDVMRGI